MSFLRIPLCILPVLLALSWSTGCGRKQEQTERAEAPAIRVLTIVVDAKRVPEIESVVGTVRPRVTAAVSAKIMAAIEKIPVKAGDAVRAGDLLAKLDDRGLRADFEKAKTDFDRYTSLLKQDAATRAELDDVRAKFRVAQANLSYATITAPFDGIVSEKLCDAGDMAAPGKPLFTVEQPTAFRLEASVPERFASAARVGTKVRVTIDALGGDCEGVVGEVIPAADPSSRSVLVKVDLQCRQPVKTGSFGRAHLVVGERSGLFVPRSVVHERGQLMFVWVAADGRAQMRLVKTGKTLGDQVELLSGVQPGERVIGNADGEPADGQRIEER